MKVKVFLAHAALVGSEWGSLVGSPNHGQVDLLAFARNRDHVLELCKAIGTGEFVAKQLKAVTPRSTALPGNAWEAFMAVVPPSEDTVGIYMKSMSHDTDVYRLVEPGIAAVMGGFERDRTAFQVRFIPTRH